MAKIILLEAGLPLLVDLRGLPIVKPNDVILIRNLEGDQIGPLIVNWQSNMELSVHEPFEEEFPFRLDREKWAIKLVGRAEVE